MRPLIRLLSFALAAAALAAAPLAASADGGHGGGGHWGGGGWHGHGGYYCCGVSIGVGFGGYYPYYPYYGYYPYYPYYYPGYAVATAPAYPVTAPSGDTVVSTVPQQQPATPPEPVVYPRNGQSPEQTEADRRDCDRWAMSQPRAMADATVFHRATIACLEGRGYTVR